MAFFSFSKSEQFYPVIISGCDIVGKFDVMITYLCVFIVFRAKGPYKTCGYRIEHTVCLYIYRRASIYTLKGEHGRIRYSGERTKVGILVTTCNRVNTAIVISCMSFSIQTTEELLLPTPECIYPPISLA